ncbi:MAG TPA: response regulator transcription factor [Gaiellaceae bacterium]|nr:response regulator transcription factor [Gaiellaceae bacterium]
MRVALADPFPVFRLGVSAILSETGEFEVSEAASLDELEELLAVEPAPDLALVDLDLPTSPADAVALLCQNQVAPVVWAKRDRLSANLVFELIQAGAVGVLTKEISPGGLLRALRGTIKGQAALGRETAWLLIQGAQASSMTSATAQRAPLSRRELEVLELVADGRPNKAIAAHLGLSEFTVKRHVQNILRKIGARSRWEASVSYLAQRDAPAPMSVVLSGMETDPES